MKMPLNIKKLESLKQPECERHFWIDYYPNPKSWDLIVYCKKCNIRSRHIPCCKEWEDHDFTQEDHCTNSYEICTKCGYRVKEM